MVISHKLLVQKILYSPPEMTEISNKARSALWPSFQALGIYQGACNKLSNECVIADLAYKQLVSYSCRPRLVARVKRAASKK